MVGCVIGCRDASHCCVLCGSVTSVFLWFDPGGGGVNTEVLLEQRPLRLEPLLSQRGCHTAGL